jgi:hypothetical protein
MMQMLDSAGIQALTDAIRAADTDNPRGYFEFEPVKKTKEDPSWLPAARGRVVKLVSSLLYDLPPTESYRVVFMERDLDEVLASQEEMLTRLGRSSAPAAKMKASFEIHLRRLFDWLPRQPHLKVHRVSYNSLMRDPAALCASISAFLDHRPPPAQMLAAIDPSLYRKRGHSTFS